METPHRHGPTTVPPTTLRGARWPSDLDLVRELYGGYRDWISEHRDTDPASHSRVEAGLALVDRLVAELPGAYGPPRGDVLLWFRGEAAVACGAMRELEPEVGELKRIFVRPDYRGSEFGKPFVRACVERARELGFVQLRVDCLSTMAAAIEFYQEAGFRPISAFWPHPAPGALFFERGLSD